MKLNFQQEAFILPASVLTYAAEADAATLKILLWLATDLSLAKKPKQLAKLADCDAKDVKAAIKFWQFRGVLTEEAEEGSVPAMAEVPMTPAPPKKPLLRRADELPSYSTTELADLMEQRASVRTLVDEAQKILGKMFNPGEVNILIGMLDYLGMNEECILLMLAYCKKIGRSNLRSIEKFAFSLADKGIDDSEKMEAELCTLEKLHSFEGQVRSLFGMNSRALTTKEGKMLAAWVSFGYDIEVVRMAYEITVNATNEPSLNYANAILERWNADGLKTVEAIQKSIDESRAKREGRAAQKNEFGNSFDTDDFFEAALRRSFQD